MIIIKAKPCTDHLGNTFKSRKEMCDYWNITITMYDRRKHQGLPMDQILQPRKLTTGCTDHLGNTFKSRKEMCDYWNITIAMYENRKRQGLPIDQILQPRKLTTGCTDHLGNTFKSRKEMCDYWNIPTSIFYGRYNTCKWSLKDSLETPYDTKITDHLGNTFATQKEMCAYWNIKYGLFHKRHDKLKWSLQDSLEKPVGYDPKTIITDHLGNTFATQKEMCEYWNIAYVIFYKRYITEKWSLKDALETPSKSKKKSYVDHLGNTFLTQKEMCEYWNITSGAFHDRYITKKWSLKNALETPMVHGTKKIITDHLGNTFTSIKEMCEYWNIAYFIFYKRYNKHKLSLKDSLENPIETYDVTDHLGNTFTSIKEMCEHWNIPYHIFNKRYNKHKLSLKDSLENPIETYDMTDHLNNTFISIKEMCEHWNVSYATYSHRIKKYTLLESLNIISPITILSKNQTITPDLSLIEHIHENYFLCTLNNQQVVFSKEQIIEIATDYYKTLHQQKGA